MSNFLLDLASAISKTDDGLRTSYATNGIATVHWAFALMKLQSGWQGVLSQDTIDAVYAAISPHGAALAASFKLQYQGDTEAKDIQCAPWDSLIQTGQTDINSDSDGRKGNFKLADGLAATSSQCISLLINF